MWLALEPPSQPRHPHGRRHPGPPAAQRGPRRTTTRNSPVARPSGRPCAPLTTSLRPRAWACPSTQRGIRSGALFDLGYRRQRGDRTGIPGRTRQGVVAGPGQFAGRRRGRLRHRRAPVGRRLLRQHRRPGRHAGLRWRCSLLLAWSRAPGSFMCCTFLRAVAPACSAPGSPSRRRPWTGRARGLVSCLEGGLPRRPMGWFRG